ncbi:molybdenum ABC transporter ATP-binding protein [Psychromonas sp. psych-6C06]|uniref:molybdenum ABC transporter ATP-binding protein n=1 Tax=Psychromonas sp. psych-6C06 TaxID=2058089 RepID=UPI000C339855|nr:ATP-binding cassette domain-containing protein [Psychromonas sp. psych-6C06]PKF60668.1 molybdenum ABC transporter ATP-binding protein [Psychromonas sp. psych-6C06]
MGDNKQGSLLSFELTKKSLFSFSGELELNGVCGIFGDSGAGKTTLVRSLIGLESGFSGDVSFAACQWQSEHVFIKTENRAVGMVFQEPRLFPHLDTRGNLLIAESKQSLYSLNELAHLLQFSTLLDKKISMLSGGQKQRIAIARAILTAPQMLIMDEPLSSLDKHSRNILLPFIKKLSQQIPVLYITHSMQELFYLANNMMLVHEGKVEAIGKPQVLFLDPSLSLVKHADCGLLLTVENLRWNNDDLMWQGTVDDQVINLTFDKNMTDTVLQIKVESKDVIIATEMLTSSSLQNCLLATMTQIEKISISHILLTLNLGQQSLLAKITVKSLQQLKLKVGQKVYCYIKAVSMIGELP